MSGVKGKGGVKGKSGGARAGAGRKPKPEQREMPILIESAEDDALKLLHDIAFGRIDATSTQLRAAIAAVQYTHAKVGEGGKKERKQADAHKVAGKFRPSAPPKLVAVK